MRRGTKYSTSLALALLGANLALVPSANAGGCVGRQGASALVQYCEAVPTADGGRQSPGSPSAASSSQTRQSGPASKSSSSTDKALSSAGADGAAVAAIAGISGRRDSSPDAKSTNGRVASSAPGSGNDGDREAQGGSRSTVSQPADPAGSPLAATREAVETGPTAGPAITWSVVGMSALGAIAAVLIRRRPVRVDEDASSDEPRG